VVKILEEAEIRQAISLSGAREAMSNAFATLAAGDAIAPDELAMKLKHGGELHVKGAYLGGDWIAFKAATGQFPGGGNSGFTAVLSADTGAPVAILQDGGWLTEIRTAAASALSASVLARPGSTSLAILGGGFQASYQVAAYRDAFALTDVTVWSRSVQTAERFAAENDAVAVASISDAVADADIVVCCTPSTEPLLDFEMLQPGTHITAVGADMIGKRELASDVLERCDILTCDSVEVSAAVGELQHATGLRHRAVDLGSILNGAAEARTSDQQITVSDLCGLGVQDAAMAELVMTSLEMTSLEMTSPGAEQ